MKVAVIGSNGFIGSRIVESFHLGAGPTVVSLVHDPAHVALSARFAIDVRQADALDLGGLTEALHGCGAVIHAGRHPLADRKQAATVLCRAAAKAGVRRVILLSSAQVHGQNPSPGTDERVALKPDAADEIAAGYAAAERQFFTEGKRLGLITFALRPAIVYGPRSPLVADVVQQLQSAEVSLRDYGEGISNALYVDNLIAAIATCLKAKTGDGRAYLLRDAETVTWRDFRDAIARELDQPVAHVRSQRRPAAGGSIDSPPTVPLTPMTAASAAATPEREFWRECSWQMPMAAATQGLGYQPAVPFAEGIRRACAWWRFAQGDYFVAA